MPGVGQALACHDRDRLKPVLLARGFVRHWTDRNLSGGTPLNLWHIDLLEQEQVMKRVSGIGAALIVATVAIASAMTASAQPPEGRGGPEGGGPGGQRRGPPSPERFVEHAMEFDADGDGKLDRSELTKFAEEMHAMRMRGGPGGPGGGGGGFQGGGQRSGPGGGRGPRGEGQGGSGGPPSDGERPERPRRPE